MRIATFAAGIVFLGFAAGPAFAEEACEGGACALPAVNAATPSAREVVSAVDAYLAPATADATLVGGAGSAGYDGGFWIRGGSFLLKINLTIQTRYEAFKWEDNEDEPAPGGDLSGFSLPRVTLKLSGDALCDMHYYAELEFGHPGSLFDNNENRSSLGAYWDSLAHNFSQDDQIAPFFEGRDFGIAREAWIEWDACPQAALRMGLVKTAATRQLMTPPEMQQFVDISMASAFIGSTMPGYTDRNRDYGVMVHGRMGCDQEWSYMATVTNGDGPVHRNVIDGSTSDDLAYSARVNWDIKGHMGYEEGALKQRSCEWTAALGGWIHGYHDHAAENSFVKWADRITWGIDGAVGYGGWSFTGAYNAGEWTNSDIGLDATYWSWFIQAGYLFPDTAWEIAARYGSYEWEYDSGSTYGATEWGVAVNYYIDGHANKLTVDASFITSDSDGNLFGDVYAGYNVTGPFGSGSGDAMLLRFQWQLAL